MSRHCGVTEVAGGWTRARWLLPVVFSLILMWAVSTNAQAVGEQREQAPTIDKAARAEIIDSLSATLNRIYVFPEMAKKMEKHMRDQLKDGAYDDLKTTAELTRKLSEELRDISQDGHLWVRFVPNEEYERFLPDTLSDEERQRRQAEFLREAQYDNFGFHKAERMSGNVGYLRFDGFQDARDAGATAVAALNFLAYCDALIIDLRNNGGGQPSMIQLITSYFFEWPVHLNSFYIREQDSIKQFWTQEQVQGPRMADVDIYVLTSNRTYSAAEEFTYNMKNLERGTIVGETTGGGAHPTNRFFFPNLNMAMSCPFGRAINPISGTNWEGTGVEPDIAVPQEEALDAAHIDAMKKLAEKTDEQRIRESLLWNIETKEALLNPVEVDEAVLKSYVGKYGPRTIVYEDGALYYERVRRPKMKMVAMAEDLFCFEEIDYFRLKVNVDADGNPTELVGMYSGGDTDVSPRDPEQ